MFAGLIFNETARGDAAPRKRPPGPVRRAKWAMAMAGGACRARVGIQKGGRAVPGGWQVAPKKRPSGGLFVMRHVGQLQGADVHAYGACRCLLGLQMA